MFILYIKKFKNFRKLILIKKKKKFSQVENSVIKNYNRNNKLYLQ